MKGGRIIVHGNAGDEIGCWMRGGIIRIQGNAGSFPGIHMIDGVIMVEGDCCGRAGAEMTGGKIIIQGMINSKLSSFQTSTIKKKVKIEGTKIEGPFYLFEGDVNEQGSGKLYINKAHNIHLSWCEEFIGEIE
jgi:formylmethanofuran dehydrogenase subunit C